MESWIVDILDPHVKEPKLEVPRDPSLGDYAFACFDLAKEKKKNPVEIAKELASKIKPDIHVHKIVAAGPYVNFFINKKELAKHLLIDIFEQKKDFGRQKKNKKTVVIDYSAPNIAKPFGIGHLRSTVIGNSLLKLHIFMGYKAIGMNHLGDWGTQFGKEIAAWKRWGDEKKLKEDPIAHLLELYVRFHKEEETNPEMIEEGRDWFAKLEQGDKEAVRLWTLFRDVSLQEFNRVYKMLNVHFDFHYGEAFYAPKAKEVIEKFKKKGLAKEDEGALIVELGLKHAPPLMLQKSNETTTYHTRDLATALWRLDEFNPDKVLYCVGSEQIMHFEQLFKALELYGIKNGIFEHIVFGRYRFPEGGMSTRKGNIIFMEDVLNRSIELAKKTIEEKNPLLKNKENVAHQVGVGAIVFGDLVNDRTRDIVFDWKRILDFEGETAPYLQYAHARCCSIIKRSGHGVSPKVNVERLSEPDEEKIVVRLSRFQSVVQDATKQCKPHILARYLLDLGQEFNTFYHNCPVLSEVKESQALRLLLVDSVRQVLEIGLNLLGIEAPEEM